MPGARRPDGTEQRGGLRADRAGQRATQLFRDEDQVYEKEQLAQRLSGWADKYPQIPAQRIVSRDRPAHLLIEQSRRAHLVVGGSRGHGELAGLVLGSMSNALVHKSVCPMAIVRPSSPHRA
jgi:nucleotide-binding universal stress UspA family protein